MQKWILLAVQMFTQKHLLHLSEETIEDELNYFSLKVSKKSPKKRCKQSG